MDQIVQIISTVGFPIACAIALGWYACRTTDKLVALTEKVTNALTQSNETIRDLTDAIEKLKD